MMIWVLILIFLVVVGMNWWVGTWNTMINLINFFISALVASSFFEPLASLIESFRGTYALLVDFVAIWILFAATFGVLRGATDFLTKYQLQMNRWVDYSIRAVLSIWLACGFVCFTCFTLQLAPLPPDQFDVPAAGKLVGFGPDQMWMAFIQSRSRGALLESKVAAFLPVYDLQDHPDDAKLEARVFDPYSTFAIRSSKRRMAISKNESLRVAN